ncbi:hypothetical protein H6F74_18860 [Trichocoleus sp. FACHB-90]|uniref:hypothetical protein n=1 Tax=Cyanophyceae TaxID=3028117 RepID=UPI0016851311|nr:hypothetical protein [Trichocoleus sp. FACHB-90]MBD1834863.1 hypothetical protein [Cyanobacteria bacterium FACHB-472]MBD1928292.1 hypothetical protein [Trichocoleus sp. FACHB-90]
MTLRLCVFTLMWQLHIRRVVIAALLLSLLWRVFHLTVNKQPSSLESAMRSHKKNTSRRL